MPRRKKRPAKFNFKPFSPQQQRLIHWWRPMIRTSENNYVIADGSIRSGKTIACIIGFLTWSQEMFSGESFILAGKTMGALKKNVVRPMLQMLEAWGWPYEYIRSGTDARLEIGTNTYYLYGAKETDTPEDIEELVSTGSTEPLFQIVAPNICNNIDLDSPLGISVYANGIDEVKGCDLTYDSYMNEFVLGRKRIMVPISQARVQMEKDGTVSPTFDPNDTVYYLLPEDRSGNNQLTEVDMTIRAQEHELGIQKSLDLLSLKVGMGAGRYRYDSGGVKTATEVISDKSDLYQNRQKHCIVIEDVIINMVRAVSFLDVKEAVEATVDFDDSIIEDSNTLIDKNIKLVNAGLRSKLTAIMEINKCSEVEALEELERIREDNQITGQDIDWTGGDDDELDEENDMSEEEEKGENQDSDDFKSGKTSDSGNKK